MMKILLLVACAVLAGYLVLWWGTKVPVPHRGITRKRLQALLTVLLEKGGPSATLIIDVDGTDRFLQFQRYEGPGHGGLELAFPKAPWSVAYYDGVRRVVGIHGFATNIVLTGDEDRLHTTEFLVVDLGSNLPAAADFAWDVLTTVLRSDPPRDCVARLQGTNP